MARRGSSRAGLWLVLFRHVTDLTSEEYVSRQAWRNASISSCPLHSKGGCGFKRNGTYARKFPVGMRIQRYYCPEGRMTFSLIPDCLAARVSGSLVEIEAAVAAVETEKSRGASIESTAGDLRPNSELPGAVRWTQRRRRWVYTVLHTVAGILPKLFAGRELTVLSLRSNLLVDSILVHLRGLLANHIQSLPAPVGFGHLEYPQRCLKKRQQHSAGPDPPVQKGYQRG